MTRPALPRNLFLIGYRGTGKSTVAAIVAVELGWQRVDADAMLEARAGRSIREIFATEGEAGFRKRESDLLEEICQSSRQVVATGGGVVLAPQNRVRLATSGACLLLEADVDTIERRMQGDPASTERRPDLTVGGRAEIEALLAQRQPLYRECARARFDVIDRTPSQVAEAILAWWENER
jgi:shikimate kinase